MKVVITIQHPAHIHFFKNIVKKLTDRGHDVYVYYRDEELVEVLLRSFDINGIKLVGKAENSLLKTVNQVQYEVRLYRHAKQIEPDIITGVGGIAAAHVAHLLNVKSIVFTDSGDHARINRIGTRFADVVCTPSSLSTDYGENQIRYDGYHELAYLHPNNFEPEKKQLQSLGVTVDEPYSVVRFVSWEAQHDIGQAGFSFEDKKRLIGELQKFGDVYITAEGELPDVFEELQLPVPADLIHHLLYYADLYIGDSQTMATEAAVLGTPAVRSNSFAGEDDMDNFIELENKYGLLFSTPDAEEALSKAVETLNNRPQQSRREKRDTMLKDKIDVTEFVVDTIEKIV